MSKVMEVLEKIAENTASSIDPVWVAAITGGTAILTALITVGSTVHIQSKNNDLEQQKLIADVITRERMRWLKDLRDLAGSNYAYIDLQYNLLKRKIDVPRDQFQSQLDEISTKIMKQSNDIILMLNKNDPAQAEVFDAIQNVQKFILECVSTATLEAQSFDDARYGEIKNKFFNAMNEIGCETWKQIKNLS
ncbi:hypothetical protein [Vibrio vulnificus]|uniref:hypothetical protein n=1 Tax=Vibrio vulnificus TaxID=672 RepID=UPI0001F5C422|nr:hypothetical protein [Vibrio vulnificus]ADV86355.1 hypothetical protein VVMO6_01333 [Vibrio vulnificus MO6-24/O]EGR0040848.1 hypothetical protein [Vibrio vulnificus]EGR0093374.1 hypothetical protein [Vibrio vulnificus]EGR0098168.1 hypothetical protein [Vibrio vulnificus]EGR7945152.1 hypothetical protein [Vibrio vulnificus]